MTGFRWEAWLVAEAEDERLSDATGSTMTTRATKNHHKKSWQNHHITIKRPSEINHENNHRMINVGMMTGFRWEARGVAEAEEKRLRRYRHHDRQSAEIRGQGEENHRSLRPRVLQGGPSPLTAFCSPNYYSVLVKARILPPKTWYGCSPSRCPLSPNPSCVAETLSYTCCGKTSLEGNNSSSVCYVTFLVYFLTMALQTGCEIMNSEVAGSILTVFPEKIKKRDFVTFKNL